LWVRIPLGTWMFVCCECCVLSGRGLCDELITRLEESYRMSCVVVCDLGTSKEEAKSPLKGCEYKPTMGCDAERKKNYYYYHHHHHHPCYRLFARYLQLYTPNKPRF